MVRVGLLISGFKGINFLRTIYNDCKISFVSSYLVKGTLDNAFDDIKSYCLKSRYKFIERQYLSKELLSEADIFFVVGWQFIINEVDDRFIVFHDSLLPKFRGFSPTVTALILGEKTIGVTALRPSADADRGPIYGQLSVEIKYPVKIKDAFLLLNNCYAQLTKNILTRFEKGILVPVFQDESLATYSIWRDELDYFIDWSWPADKIARFVDAVGWPYHGSKALYQSSEIIIDEVVVLDDIIFEERQYGKIWTLKDGMPEVICGKGMLRLVSVRDSDGNNVVFKNLRARLSKQ